ncbi:uncharacterized protein BDV14DRAFT_201617 [Aspergillus stella-maris]|uniref:uncharacterized protein n=1 Tax=Aspergillus stella-maris TaxID=1810926 RepID=UPI003CCDDF36
MALISPTNLLTLHHTSADQIRDLQDVPSRRYNHVNDSYPDEQPLRIPDPAIFTDLPVEDQGNTLPRTAQCATHLEMLEVFHAYRNEIIASPELDEAFSIAAQPQIKYRKKWNGREFVAEAVSIRDPDFEERRKQKWTFILRIAALRFCEWIHVIDYHLKNAEFNPDVSIPRYLLLPPLDILIIWHAFLLNCNDFKNYCERGNLSHIQDIEFPWADIHVSIDSSTWTYTLPDSHAEWLSNTNIAPEITTAIIQSTSSSHETKILLSKFDHYRDIPNGNHDPLFQTLRTARSYQSTITQLVSNVERQCIFIDKMHAHRWIRSPAVHGTLTRAVKRYNNFLHLFRLYPSTFFVPTLDVDLVWHTHQLSASIYRSFVVDRVGKFINHEDKIGRGTLDTGFSSAETLYRLRFGEQYRVCLCWGCEGILDAVENVDEDDLDEGKVDLNELAQGVEKRVHYYREMEITRCLGGQLPIWSHGLR